MTPNKTSAVTDFLGSPGPAPTPYAGVLTGLLYGPDTAE